MMRTPEFWRGEGPLARILEPFGLLYGAATAWRLARTQPWRAPVPVVCVGNLVAGGAGKTPVALAVARHLRDKGRHPVFLSRGHGGSARGPLRVDPARDGAARVGDEALLLAAEAPTIVARLRVAGARLAVAEGADVIIMDDGYQNPGLYKDVALVVVDGGYGFGNGRLLPAGPLREPVARGLKRASAVVLVGEDRHALTRRFPVSMPVLKAHLLPGLEAVLLAGQRVVAFAGIGRPEKFFATVRDVGAHVVACHPFADHRFYAPVDIEPILDEAFSLGAIPVTTAKDAVRLPPDQRQQVTVLTVRLAWNDETALDTVLNDAVLKRRDHHDPMPSK